MSVENNIKLAMIEMDAEEVRSAFINNDVGPSESIKSMDKLSSQLYDIYQKGGINSDLAVELSLSISDKIVDVEPELWNLYNSADDNVLVIDKEYLLNQAQKLKNEHDLEYERRGSDFRLYAMGYTVRVDEIDGELYDSVVMEEIRTGADTLENALELINQHTKEFTLANADLREKNGSGYVPGLYKPVFVEVLDLHANLVFASLWNPESHDNMGSYKPIEHVLDKNQQQAISTSITELQNQYDEAVREDYFDKSRDISRDLMTLKYHTVSDEWQGNNNVMELLSKEQCVSAPTDTDNAPMVVAAGNELNSLLQRYSLNDTGSTKNVLEDDIPPMPPLVDMTLINKKGNKPR